MSLLQLPHDQGSRPPKIISEISLPERLYTRQTRHRRASLLSCTNSFSDKFENALPQFLVSSYCRLLLRCSFIRLFHHSTCLISEKNIRLWCGILKHLSQQSDSTGRGSIAWPWTASWAKSWSSLVGRRRMEARTCPIVKQIWILSFMNVLFCFYIRRD